jgi:pyruvate/2-oxoglutarate dehydrogenase complex dihydrolipoamide acyltransferase (E2) component
VDPAPAASSPPASTHTETLASHPSVQRIEALAEPYALTVMEVDLGAVAAARAQIAAAGRGLVAGDHVLVAHAAVMALARHLLLNAVWTEDWLVLRRRVHLAVIQPDGERRVVGDAQDRNALGIARAFARPAAAQPAEGTFTLIDLGGQPVYAMPPLPMGQTAALGVVAARQRPVVVSQGGVDRVAVRPIAQLVLAYDARVLDQCHADAFLNDVRGSLERQRP